MNARITKNQSVQTKAVAANVAQKKSINSGLPDNLKSGIESLSGHSMDDVKVHYNSGRPAQLQAHAFAQGNQIHLAPGQEKHLPHEAWHVVQQKQGRVKPTIQLKSSIPVNDDPGLEKEADVMGVKALSTGNESVQLKASFNNYSIVQRYKLNFENLKAISTVSVDEGGGKGLVAGSKIPHRKMAIEKGDTDLSYHVDDWTNKKGKSDKEGAVTQEQVGKDFIKIFNRSARKKTRKLISSWSCSHTILNDIVNEFILIDQHDEKWYAKQMEEDHIELNVKDATKGAEALVAHLLSLRASVFWRENTMKKLNVNTVTIKYREGAQSKTEDVTLNWDNLALKTRQEIKTKLAAGTAPPSKPPSTAESGGIMNGYIFDAMQSATGFSKLYSKDIIREGHGGGYSFNNSQNTRVENNKEATIKNAANHLRFALWTEWRAVHEILKGQML